MSDRYHRYDAPPSSREQFETAMRGAERQSFNDAYATATRFQSIPPRESAQPLNYPLPQYEIQGLPQQGNQRTSPPSYEAYKTGAYAGQSPFPEQFLTQPNQFERQPIMQGPRNQAVGSNPGGAENEQMRMAQGILASDKASASQKLQVVQALSHAGVHEINLPDRDGNMRQYSIGTEQIGGREMVHLFSNDDQGKRHIVLRGIANGDGTFAQERDGHGRSVNFEGDWWSQHMSARSALAGSDAGSESRQDMPANYDRYSQGRYGAGTPYGQYGPHQGRYQSQSPYQQGESPYGGQQGAEQPGAGQWHPGQRWNPQTGRFENPDQQNRYEQNPFGHSDSGNPSVSADRLASVATQVAAHTGTVGWCARGVHQALQHCGMNFAGADAWQFGHELAASGKFERVPLSEARRGDIIVRSWNSSVIAQHRGRNSGDIVVVTGRSHNGTLMGANDHLGVIHPDGGRYVNSFVLRLRGENA